MNQLLSIRTNIMYAKKIKKEEDNHEEEFVKYHELIFLVDKPAYRQTNDNEIIRERGIEELRFTVSETSFDELIKLLLKLKSIDEKELDM